MDIYSISKELWSNNTAGHWFFYVMLSIPVVWPTAHHVLSKISRAGLRRVALIGLNAFGVVSYGVLLAVYLLAA